MTALTRGPLPARVYWRRRLLLILVALGLVVGTARLLGLGSDASSEQPPQATQAAAEPTTTTATSEAPTVEVSDIPSESRRAPRAASEEKRDRKPVLAEPEGVCADRDVAVTPSVRKRGRRRPGHLHPRAAHHHHAGLHLAGLAGDAHHEADVGRRRHLDQPGVPARHPLRGRRHPQQRRHQDRGHLVGPALRRRVLAAHRVGAAGLVLRRRRRAGGRALGPALPAREARARGRDEDREARARAEGTPGPAA